MTEVHDSTLELFRAARAALGQASDLLDKGLGEVMEQEPQPAMLTLYSMRDPRWRDLEYAGGVTFATAGCYVVAVAVVLSLAGYTDDPPEVARKLRDAGCFGGANLSRLSYIVDAYPLMRYDGPIDASKDGPLRWHDCPADLERLRIELEQGPVIIEADFVTVTPAFNQHFCVALGFTDTGDDIWIADPWDGSETLLLERYAQDHWDLARAVYGVRLLRIA